MRIAIVEDDLTTALAFSRLIDRFSQTHDIAVTQTRFDSGIAIVDHYQPVFDVIYLDIQMAHLDGMTAAKKIRAKDPTVLIVFVTNYVQYAIDGYAVDATDFLLKPVTAFAFAEHFKKIQARLAARETPTLTLKANGELIRLAIPAITYIESRGHYLTVHTADRLITSLDTLRHLEAQLAPHHFYRCNNSYLVNLAQVGGIENGAVLVAGTPLQISRPRKKAFLAALTDYLGGEA
ncbi:LytR/AlgR family response regulator transcription factor [Lacticaseibacillus daqingensis]|uniref:LytR/AlgR family response regulator transcription factor n=1 Tax=Lacticaseibacillus daqingensis TaxID=2486014 RepID=UPI000F774AF2|nr:LytTR family DNA-binding domain-containing protein [Lacticaseibacillus daqingensis]